MASIPTALRRALPFGLSLSSLALVAAAHAQSTTLSQVPVPQVVAGASVVGRVAPATVLNMSISLKPRDRAAFQDFANRVSDRRSPDYHHFLTPAQIGEKFGPTQDTVNTTVAYLKSKGMTVTLVAGNRMAILFKGRADKAESAFSTKLYNYRNDARTDGPTRFFSFTTAPKVPTKWAPQVVSITGLQNAYTPLRRSTLTPSQTRQLYNAATLYGTTGRKGEGVNVGITNFDGYRLSNLPLFYSTFGLTAPAGGVGSNVTKVSVDGFDGETATPGAEGDLDIQLALAMAPRCNMYVYDSNDFVATAVRQANDDVVDIVSESYGHTTNESTRSAIVAAHDQHVAMTAQGITYLLATGDYGTDLLGYDYPNFDPEILQVGGSVATVDSLGNRINEVGWDGSGSGWSTFVIDFNTLPTWLVGSTVPTNTNRRIFPDVALHAYGGNGDAYNFVFQGSVSAVSGTSASSPIFAGQLAIILQELAAEGAVDLAGNGRARLGRINDFIYELNGDPAVFLDLLGGDAGALPDGQESVGQTGWDYVTGWGAPDVNGLLEAFAATSSIVVSDVATDVNLYTSTRPNITFGTAAQGDVSVLPTTDGLTYSVLTVKQSGVGQVCAATIDFALQGDSAKRRGVDFTVVFSTPALTTGFVYAYNYTTGVYDVLKTQTGTGTAKTVTIRSLDLTKYVQNDEVQIMIRALKPTRLGSSPFRLDIDQATVTERVARG